MKIRNVAIIAHVDHGKTTLVDALLRQSKTRLDKEVSEAGLIMDSNELERERGITIFSKNASVMWEDTKINIIDTPGHADFGGEVERVLSMADGCLLLVDAKEGPMPQTRFVLKHALKKGLKVIVVINKVDKPDARVDYVHDKTLELFMELGANDNALDFPTIYAIGKEGRAGYTPNISDMKDITPVFESILKYIPAPTGDENKPLQMLVTTIGGDNFRGRIATGRIYNGIMKMNQDIIHIDREGQQRKGRLSSIMLFDGMTRVDVSEACAGDLVAIAGIPEIMIGETIADKENPIALPLLAIEEPTVKMTFSVNDSPFAGQEGIYTTSRQLKERLFKELETDTALHVSDSLDGGWSVLGRGELHLAIFIERLRREGYEFQVSRPHVIVKKIDGVTMAPYDDLFIEVPEAYAGVVMQKIGARYGELQNMSIENGIQYLEFIIPTRGLFGYRTEFLSDTRGLGIMNSTFEGYRPDVVSWREREQGSLVASDTGVTTMYALLNIQERGVLFVEPGMTVYKGQVVGQNARQGDLRVNVCKAKQMSNVRSKGEGVDDHFNAPRIMDLEDALEYIADDELVEVTPKNVRTRKRIIDESEAKRIARGINI